MMPGFDAFFGVVSYQPFWFFNTLHCGIASINTCRTIDAFELCAVADINTGWTNNNTLITINTIAVRFIQWAAGFATFVIVSYNNGFFIYQNSLQPSIRAGNGTYLFAEESKNKIIDTLKCFCGTSEAY